MRKLFIILFMLLATSYGFGQVLNPKELIILEGQGSFDSLYIDNTTVDKIISRFGKTKVKSKIEEFTYPNEPWYQLKEIIYTDLGLKFTFRSRFSKTKKLAKARTCKLSQVILLPNSKYCIENICPSTSRHKISEKLEGSEWNITSDSTKFTQLSKGFIVLFDKEDVMKIAEIRRQVSGDWLMKNSNCNYQNKVGNTIINTCGGVPEEFDFAFLKREIDGYCGGVDTAEIDTSTVFKLGRIIPLEENNTYEMNIITIPSSIEKYKQINTWEFATKKEDALLRIVSWKYISGKVLTR